MTKIMTAPEVVMTDGQIENAVNKLRDAMRKHRSEIPSHAAQRVLGVTNLGMMMFTPFRELAKTFTSFIVNKVKVNRNRSPQEAIDATCRKQHTDRKVVDSMPKGEGGETKIVFFRPSRSISDDDVEKEYELRGLKPVDPFSLAALNEANPAFADETPHTTHWKDAKGNWCCAAFNRWFGVRRVDIDRHDCEWEDRWWFAGIPK